RSGWQAAWAECRRSAVCRRSGDGLTGRRPILDGILDGQRCAPGRDTAHADDAPPVQDGTVAADVNLLAVVLLDEGPVRTLVHQHEVLARRFDPGMHAGNEVALDDDVVLVGATH